jgi:hypothetical protein
MDAEKLRAARRVLWDYLMLCVDSQDLHGVRDACVDIEKLDAQLELLNEIFHRRV